MSSPSIRMSPKVNPDTKEHAPVLWYADVTLIHDPLYRYRAFHGIDDRAKLEQQAITRGLDDTAAMLGD